MTEEVFRLEAHLFAYCGGTAPKNHNPPALRTTFLWV